MSAILIFSLTAVSCVNVPASNIADRYTQMEVARAIYSPQMACIRSHESDHNPAHGPLFLEGAMAQNPLPGSTAAGFYQFVIKTWRSQSKDKGFPEFSGMLAKHAPEEVQHVVAFRILQQGGKSNWKGAVDFQGRSCFRLPL